MSIVVVGIPRHARADFAQERTMQECAERMELAHDPLDRLHAVGAITESCVLVTPQRLEIYAVTSSSHPGVEQLISFLERMCGLESGEVRADVYVHRADAAAAHLMNLASGANGGEAKEDVLAGLRAAYSTAAGAGTMGPRLHTLVQSALQAGKKARGSVAKPAKRLHYKRCAGKMTGRKPHSFGRTLCQRKSSFNPKKS